eukprot:6683496-Prymnesium_polylepis.1
MGAEQSAQHRGSLESIQQMGFTDTLFLWRLSHGRKREWEGLARMGRCPTPRQGCRPGPT